MKRVFCLLIILFISLNVLGCTEKIESEEPMQNNVSNVLYPGCKPFTMITKSYTKVSSTEDGLYQLFQNEDSSYNIMYNDYETKTQIYLCALPNCNHNNGNCTSYVTKYGGVTLGATSTCILIIYTGESFSGMPARIEKADLNGANRKVLFTFEEGLVVGEGVAANDTHVVVKAETYSTGSDGQVLVTQSLVAVNYHTGEKEIIFTLEPTTNDIFQSTYTALFLIGATNDAFILKTITPMENEVSNNAEESTDVMSFSLKEDVYSVPYSGEDPKIILSYIQGTCNTAVYGDFLFYFKQQKDGRFCLNKVNPITMTDEPVIENFNETNIETTIPNSTLEDTFAVGIVDNQLQLNHFTSKKVLDNGNIEYRLARYSVDINSGDITEITLANYYSATLLPIEIVTQVGDKLVVYAAVEDTFEEGGTLPMPEKKLGIISIEDYFASNPNYEMIDTIRYY